MALGASYLTFISFVVMVTKASVIDRVFARVPARFLKFSIVGGSGVIVNMGMLYFLTEFAGFYYLASSLIAIEVSILCNFVLNDLWTWGDKKHQTKKRYLERMARYNLSAAASGFLGNFVIMTVLTEAGGLQYLLSNFIGIGVGILLNYFLNDRWTYKAAMKL
ncbi:MAG: hypothetical protein CO189_10725 [candidate division Zixibacteria bacterium CG_4_9_14_3_um_filter_46_8]|nr:MAG: hypothetical protein CO189_10725 [candidate division Zixibacteria bacterium CG_4_9_14_3_um_filter_46_8]